MVAPKRVVIFGGTHGNEWTGIRVVQHYKDHFQKKFPGLKLEFVLANPDAHEVNRRFKDEDLNRAFQYLSEDRTSSEHLRAKELKEIIQREPCLVLDLHTTTANMGKTIILSQYNPLNLSLCEKLAVHFSDCRIIGAPDPRKKYLASQSDFGLIIEVGPVANGVVASAPLESTLHLIEFILEQVSTSKLNAHGAFEIYEEAQDVHYPKNEKGEINAYIHSHLQGKDFLPLRGKFAAFTRFNGEEISVEAKEDLFPIFINEAAYYPQQLAFTLCRKKLLTF